MKTHRTAPPITTVIPFPVPPRGSRENDDPRWQRVEALYREIAVLSPESFERTLTQLLEHAFSGSLLKILESWGVDERALMAMLAKRVEEQNIDERRAYIERAWPQYAAMTPLAPSDERLQDLLIHLQRRVEDLRRQTQRERMRGAQSK